MSGQAIAKRGEVLPATMSNNPIAQVFQQFDAKKFNLVCPVTAVDHLPPMTRVAVQVVEVDLEIDTYPIPGSNEKGVGKNALNKIAAAANITWQPERSGQVDTWNDPHRVRYRATGVITDFNGRRRVVFGEKEIDLSGDPGEPETYGRDTAEMARIAGKRDRDPWNQIMQQRQHIYSMAETKAKLRAIREALSIKAAMPVAQIARPWVVPSLVPDYDTDDPEIKRMLVAHQLGAESALYGQPAPQLAAPALPVPVEASDDPATIDAGPEPVEAGDAEPWDEPWDEPETPPPPLPISEEVIKQVPTTDERRFNFLNRLNELSAQALETLGEDDAVALFHEVGPGFDPLQAPLKDIAVIGNALLNALSDS